MDDQAPAPGIAGRYDPALLDAMSCRIGVRPAGAPHFEDVAAALRTVRRDAGALIADYDRSAADALEAVVAAEKVCCAGIGWHFERHGAPHGAARLRVEAGPGQLDALELLLRPPAG
jgi:hypothetical protein